MATTAIWDVKDRLDRVINYAVNPDKTENADFSNFHGLRDVLDYTQQDAKTEKQYYVTGVNCDPASVCEQMKRTKLQYQKTGGILAFHGYQAFAPGEATPETAHAIGVKLAKQLWGDRFEVVISTHIDKHHLHNHFVLNSVSFMDGKRYYDNNATYAMMRKASDRLCREYSLSVIENPQRGKAKHYAEWKADQEGKPTWRGLIRTDVDAAIRRSMTMTQFIRQLRDMGYEVKTGVKYMAVRPQNKERFVRLRSLGDQYTEEAIRQRILRQRVPEDMPKSAPPSPKRVKVYGDFRLYRVTWKGLRALYFHYLYKLREAQRQPSGQVPFLLREDLRYLDALTEQTKFLHRHNIDNGEQLTDFRSDAERQIAALTAERKALSNEKRRAAVPDERMAQLAGGISDLSVQLKSLRRDVKLCDDILERSIIIREKIEQMEKTDKEEKTHEQHGRCGRTNREHGD